MINNMKNIIMILKNNMFSISSKMNKKVLEKEEILLYTICSRTHLIKYGVKEYPV